jgi:hypothetical protein
VLVGTSVEGAALASVPWSARAQPATIAASQTGEFATIASVRLHGVGSVSHRVGVHGV